MSHFLTIPINEHGLICASLCQWPRIGAAFTPLALLPVSTSNDRDAMEGCSGQHSDINRPQICDLLARFFGQ